MIQILKNSMWNLSILSKLCKTEGIVYISFLKKNSTTMTKLFKFSKPGDIQKFENYVLEKKNILA